MGNGTGGTVTASQNATVGNVRITHNLGRTDYFVIATPYAGNVWSSAYVTSLQSNFVDVQFIDTMRGPSHGVLFVAIIGRDKV